MTRTKRLQISFEHLSEENQINQFLRLTALPSHFSDRKRKCVAAKTALLIDMPRDRTARTLLRFKRENNLTYTVEEFEQYQTYIKGRSFNLINYDMFYFVHKEVEMKDLEYRTGKFLRYEEVQTYLFKITAALCDNKYSGKRILKRNYLLKLNYEHFTKRKLSNNKIGHLNKILCKYNYIQIQGDNTYLFGKNNPFFHTTLMSEANRKLSLHLSEDKSPTTSEKVRQAEQDKNNIARAYHQQTEEINIYKSELQGSQAEIERLNKEIHEVQRQNKVLLQSLESASQYIKQHSLEESDSDRSEN